MIPANQIGADVPDMERLLSEHGDGLLRMCLLYLHDYQLAENAVQETYLLASRSWHRFRGKSSERTWLTKIAINVCRSQLRAGWLRKIVTQEHLPEKSYKITFPDDTVWPCCCRAKTSLSGSDIALLLSGAVYAGDRSKERGVKMGTVINMNQQKESIMQETITENGLTYHREELPDGTPVYLPKEENDTTEVNLGR